jgi:acetolactate synthase-1/3 small subunit
MTLAVRGDEKTAIQVTKQLEKLIDVIHVQILDTQTAVQRELALVKITVENSEVRREIMDYTNIFRGRVIDAAPGSIIVEITGTSDKLEAFINLIKKYGIIELSRTGVTSLSRGDTSIIKVMRSI